MKHLLGIICAALICYVSITVQTQPEGRTEAQRKADSDFINAQLMSYKSPRKMTQAQALYEVWNLTEADVAKPVNLWGK